MFFNGAFGLVAALALTSPVLAASESSSASSSITSSVVSTTSSMASTTHNSTTTSTATSSAVTATGTVYPPTSDEHWGYYGCWNETVQVTGAGGARTLDGGIMEGLNNMTVPKCLEFCQGYEFAGLEYQRECWCSYYISSIAVKLPDVQCNMGCEGNETEACGGSWKLTVYKAKSAAELAIPAPMALSLTVVLSAVVGLGLIL